MVNKTEKWDMVAALIKVTFGLFMIVLVQAEHNSLMQSKSYSQVYPLSDKKQKKLYLNNNKKKEKKF